MNTHVDVVWSTFERFDEKHLQKPSNSRADISKRFEILSQKIERVYNQVSAWKDLNNEICMLGVSILLEKIMILRTQLIPISWEISENIAYQKVREVSNIVAAHSKQIISDFRWSLDMWDYSSFDRDLSGLQSSIWEVILPTQEVWNLVTPVHDTLVEMWLNIRADTERVLH